MDDWNLYILFGVGGGLFTFFSTCFCYYKRKDTLARREEKLFEKERDEIYASAFFKPSPVATITSDKVDKSAVPASSSNSNSNSTSVVPHANGHISHVNSANSEDIAGPSSASVSSSHRRSSSTSSTKKVDRTDSTRSTKSYKSDESRHQKNLVGRTNAAFQTTYL